MHCAFRDQPLKHNMINASRHSLRTTGRSLGQSLILDKAPHSVFY